jgi:hypothetical protein
LGINLFYKHRIKVFNSIQRSDKECSRPVTLVTYKNDPQQVFGQTQSENDLHMVIGLIGLGKGTNGKKM